MEKPSDHFSREKTSDKCTDYKLLNDDCAGTSARPQILMRLPWLKAIADSGELGRSDLVNKDGTNDWVSASNIDGLIPQHRKPPPLPPPLPPTLPSFSKSKPWLVRELSKATSWVAIAVFAFVVIAAIIAIDQHTRPTLESAREHEKAITKAEIEEHPGRAMAGDTATVWAQMQADGLAFQARLQARLDRDLSPEEKELLKRATH